MPIDAAGAACATEFLAGLRRMGLLSPSETAPLTPLAGGVSSDIMRADLARGQVCVKRALPRLKVEADWHAPIERSRWEVEWMRVAGSIVPDAVPRVLGNDDDSGMFAMEYLDPVRYPVWKAQLRDGVIEPGFAADVGRRIAHIHAATARRDQMARRFATDHIFLPIRLDPYLAATARIHPDCAARLGELIDTTLRTKLTLVHGDVSPKNILCGPRGPVFLDAECAWYGDPAFDLAFCLNHLLLKCTWRPQWTEAYLACFRSLVDAYMTQVAWEPATDLEARAAHLLPGLFLARVDGKSPVEYLTQSWQRDAVRAVGRRYLLRPAERLDELAQAWRSSLSASDTTPATAPADDA